MEDEKIKDVLRDRILSNGYCKFDLLQEILPLYELLNAKPINLKLKIATILSIRVSDIPAEAFYKWRNRLKEKYLQKNNKPCKKDPSPKKPLSHPTSRAKTQIEKLNEEFTPIDPIANQQNRLKEEESSWIKPARGNND